MNGRKVLVVGGFAAALTIPAGVAVATTGTSPAPSGSVSESRGPGYGPGRAHGMGNREDCPRYNSPEMQQRRAGREERQAQMRNLHMHNLHGGTDGGNWSPPRDGTGPFHDQAPGAKARDRAS